MVSIGVYIKDVMQFKKSCKNKRFLFQIFGEREISYCSQKKEPYISYAGKFCAKEAIAKTLAAKMKLRDIEIRNKKSGKPAVYILGKRQRNMQCSISHTPKYAIAFVINMD